LHSIVDFITNFVLATGYFGVFITMLISAVVPFPSEVVLPYAGAMTVTRHLFNLHLLAFAGAIGNLIGSMIAYWIGAALGRPFFEKYGKYVLIRPRDIDEGDRWFARHGEAAVFFTRMLPVVRAVISFPAGIAKMNFVRFCVYTFFGGLIWSYFLAWIGFKLGQRWEEIMTYFHKADAGVVVAVVLLVGIWLYRHMRPETDAPAKASSNVSAETGE
jgi:membrane protein DedA with SNARE-associated domain